MKTIKWSESSDIEPIVAEAARVVESGGLVCLPTRGRYRIIADLTDARAVVRLMQSKGRVKHAPALVFIDSRKRLHAVARDVDPLALALARALWPGPLTLRVQPADELPPKVLRQLGGRKTKLGVRVPDDPLARAVAARVGRPLLVSSANRQERSGESSPAQVRKTFVGRVDLFVDGGDLEALPDSTVVDVQDGRVVVARAGAISADELERIAAG